MSMSVHGLVARINAGDYGDDEDAPPSSTVARATSRKDFGDKVAEAFEKNFPSAGRPVSVAPPIAPERFKSVANADFGDRVAASFDRLFPPKGANP